MNIDWINFLKSNQASVLDNTCIQFPDGEIEKTDWITALPHLAVFNVTGNDASQFLQGQLTCDINQLNNSTSFFTAFCNAKGRVISTILIVKDTDTYYLILPVELADKVINKLRMYILRSKVQINNLSDDLCLLGLKTNIPDLLPSLPETPFAATISSEITIKLPSVDSRHLIIYSASAAQSIWTQLTQKNKLPACNSTLWEYQDISAGIPWLNQASSEQYIPQMLNIDKLGGISFTKGCYTGQEIVARTHYLGKAKRQLYVAECDISAEINQQTQLITTENEQTVGQIISFQINEQNCRMLVIIATTDAELTNLMLNSATQNKVSIISQSTNND